jgi:hypothetical protein
MRRLTTLAATLAGLTLLTGCPNYESLQGEANFPHEAHSLLPEQPIFDSEAVTGEGEDKTEWHYAVGVTTATGPEQPIQFPHYRHVTELNMQCEYCHHSARKSIHGGVPETRVCAGCHWQVKGNDSAEIAKITSFGEGCDYVAPGTLNDKCEPIEWKKVHDLPDYVHFSHKRHVQGGVNCTECHGQVGLQGKKETIAKTDINGNVTITDDLEYVMVRETTLQMGWCLDCHAEHPSIDKNYGEKADLRRAELKDCWTCHK